jgi:hypothetical protein
VASLLETEPPVAARGLTRGPRLPQALPELTPARFAALRVVWLLALAIAIVVPLAGTWFLYQERQRIDAPFLELDLPYYGTSDGEIRLLAPWGEAAKASGVAQDDLILSVEGRPVPRDYDERIAIADLIRTAPGPLVTIETQSSDGRVRTHRLPRSSAQAEEAYARNGISRTAEQMAGTITYHFAVGFMIVAGVLLFRRRGRDPVAALLSLSFLLLTVYGSQGYAFFAAMGAPYLNVILIAIGWTCQFLALMTFPQGRFEPRWTLALAAILIAWAIVLPLGLIPDIAENLGGLAIGCACLAAMMVRYRRLAPGVQRQQIRWTLFGVTAGAFLAVLWVGAGAVIPLIDDSRLRVWLSLVAIVLTPLSFSLPPLGLLVSLLRYRLYDADAVISRSAGYAVLTLLLGAVFAGSAEALELFFEANLGREAGSMPGAIGAGLTVLLINPLHSRIEAWAERRFQRALLHLRNDLPQHLLDVRDTATSKQLLAMVLARIASGVRASRAAVLLVEGGAPYLAAERDVTAEAAAEWSAGWIPPLIEQGLDCDCADPLFPLRLALTVDGGGSAATIGWILLGPRPDGSFYGKEEREALEEVAGPIARALQIVRRHERREAEAQSRAEAQEGRIADMERKLLAALALGGAGRS